MHSVIEVNILTDEFRRTECLAVYDHSDVLHVYMQISNDVVKAFFSRERQDRGRGVAPGRGRYSNEAAMY